MAKEKELVAVGRIVHYVLDKHDSKYPGECRPAIIVKVWHAEEGLVQLQVFMDGTNDAERYHDNGTAWRTSVKPGDASEPGHHTWHWPKECPVKANP